MKLEVTTTERGFEIIRMPVYGKSLGPSRLVQQSSATMLDADGNPRPPGSSFLWVGQDHHLNRDEVNQLVVALMDWLATGWLSGFGSLPPDLDRPFGEITDELLIEYMKDVYSQDGFKFAGAVAHHLLALRRAVRRDQGHKADRPEEYTKVVGALQELTGAVALLDWEIERLPEGQDSSPEVAAAFDRKDAALKAAADLLERAK